MMDDGSRGVRLQALASDVAHTIRTMAETVDIVAEVKRLLRSALSDPDLILDCVDAATRSLVSSPPDEHWHNPPIIEDDANGFSIRLFYWRPFSENSPHRHTNWTVTGVLWNQLLFVTYVEPDGNEPPRQIDREFNGQTGDVGAILPPCIHQVRNSSADPSISIHIFSGPKSTYRPDRYGRGETKWFGANEGERPADGQDGAIVLVALLGLLESLSDRRVVLLIERLFALGDLRFKLACTKVLARHDPRRAAVRLSEVADACAEPDKTRLQTIAVGLLAT